MIYFVAAILIIDFLGLFTNIYNWNQAVSDSKIKHEEFIGATKENLTGLQDLIRILINSQKAAHETFKHVEAMREQAITVVYENLPKQKRKKKS